MKLSEELNKYFNCLVWSEQPEQGVSKDMDSYVIRVAELEAQIPQWISVEDEIPEKDMYVLIKQNYCDEIQIARWIGEVNIRWIEQHENHHCCGNAYCEFDVNDVTHWMLLPKAPEEE